MGTDVDHAIATVADGLGVPAKAVRLLYWRGEWTVEVRDRLTARSRRSTWTGGASGRTAAEAAKYTVMYLTHARANGLFHGPAPSEP